MYHLPPKANPQLNVEEINNMATALQPHFTHVICSGACRLQLARSADQEESRARSSTEGQQLFEYSDILTESHRKKKEQKLNGVVNVL